jgi:uracil-DNA glycosylase family 4
VRSNHVAMPVTDDEIHEKYLERAIREINALNHDVQDLASEDGMAVIGSGHPQADVLLLKHHATRAEQEEGVAFYGRAGQALTKSFARLGIDPTTVYGTLAAKLPLDELDATAEQASIRLLAEEIAIVQPRLIVVMGEDAVDALNRTETPLAATLTADPGVHQRFTPACTAIVTPPIDDALDDQAAKQAFWAAFREVGAWHDALPPY